MGVLRVHDGVRVIQPLERRLPAEIAVADMHAEAEDGEIVRTHVTRWEDEGGLCVSVEDRIGSFEQATCALDALVMSMRPVSYTHLDVYKRQKRLMALKMPLTEAKLMLCSVPTPKMRRPPGTRSSI